MRNQNYCLVRVSQFIHAFGNDAQSVNVQTGIGFVKHGDWWIGWIEEIPGVNCQEATREELLETLKITLQEALEFNRQDALAFARENYRELQIAI